MKKTSRFLILMLLTLLLPSCGAERRRVEVSAIREAGEARGMFRRPRSATAPS